LKPIALFRGFSDEELGRILAAGELLSVEPHANIVIEGELSGGLFLILQGIVGVYKTNKLSGSCYDVGQLREPSFFGEMSLVDDNPRSATVRALTESVLSRLVGRNPPTLPGELHSRSREAAP
jgi:CRP-like cAMP-binding protein